MSLPLLEARGVGKQYRLRAERSFATAVLRGRRGTETLWALHELDFDVLPGEIFAVIGRNGAGKSTLLKLAAGVTHPTIGTVSRPPRIAPLIEVGAGFHPDLSGRENVEVNGRLLGLKRSDIDRLFDDIVDFAELGHAIDRPIREFSTGMFMRLGFSVAVHTDPQLLVVDEVLAVGDIAFQVRCLDRIKLLRDSGVGVLFVSHNEAATLELADRALLLDHGRVAASGEPRQVVSAYHSLLGDALVSGDGPIRHGGRLTLKDAVVEGVDGQRPPLWSPGQRVRARLTLHAEDRCPPSLAGLKLYREGHGLVAGWNPGADTTNLPSFEAGEIVEVAIEFDANVTPGIYVLEVAIAGEGFSEMFMHAANAARFVVASPGMWSGTVSLNPTITTEPRN